MDEQPRTTTSIEFEGADVILRAADTDFRVHITILRLASPFFASLFSLPQPQHQKSDHTMPVIHMAEDPDVLHILMLR